MKPIAVRIVRALDFFRSLVRAEWRIYHGDRDAFDAERAWGFDGPPVLP